MTFQRRWPLALAICFVLIYAPPSLAVTAPARPPLRWYAVVVAGESRQPVFDNARQRIGDLLARLGYASAGIEMLSADPEQAEPGVEPATVAELDRAFEGVSANSADGCMLFITSHGSPHGIHLSLNNEDLTPAQLDRILTRHCGNRPTIAILSSCYSGVFADQVMQRPNRLILTAARRDRSSFGCSNNAVFTYYDEELIRLLPRSSSWADLYRSLRTAVALREKNDGFIASEPQAYFGAVWREGTLSRSPDRHANNLPNAKRRAPPVN